MLEGLTERRVAIGSEVGGVVVRLVGGAVRCSADDRLAIRRRELGIDVDGCKGSSMEEISTSAMTAKGEGT